VGDIGPCRAISNLEALLDMTHSFKRQWKLLALCTVWVAK
jgi:hypothetical protein